MKHVAALILSILMLLAGVVSPSGAKAAGSSEPAACSMSAEAGCAHCACCIAPADDSAQARFPAAVPSPDHAGRSLLAPPPVCPVPYLALDDHPKIVPLSSAIPSLGSVPLFQRHCLLLI